MKIVRFLGGLGNQMFQYAFYKSLQNRNHKVKIDVGSFEGYPLHNGFELEHIFSLQLPRASNLAVRLYDPTFREWHIRKLRKILGLKRTYYEQGNAYTFDEAIYDDMGPKMYWGYWQNIKYINPVRAQIRRDFRFLPVLSERNQRYLDKIKSGVSVSLHVRRGDYLKEEQRRGGICTVQYYQNAIQFMQSQLTDPRFYVFSDDIAWCKDHLPLDTTTFISGNQDQESYIDMYLMSHCRHHVIANSTFSWWGAWLGDGDNKLVVIPSKWINDPDTDTNGLIPENWIRI